MLALEQMLKQTAEVHKKQDLRIHTDLIFLSDQTVNLFHNQPNRVGLFVHLDKNSASWFNHKLVLVHYKKLKWWSGKREPFRSSGIKIVLEQKHHIICKNK